MYHRIFKINPDSKHSYFIFGPRGTGKTAWLRENFPNALYFDLLKDDTYRELLARPTRLSERVPEDWQDWIILDEVQKVPALLNEVHRMIEHGGKKFLLTGSSARKLRVKGVNLLAGRALTKHMHPLTTIELGPDFTIQHALRFGMLPATLGHEAVKDYLKSYITTYLREEVLQEGITRDITLFSRFLETASFSQGEVLTYTNIAREVGTSRYTVAHFFDILEDLLIATRLQVFAKRAKRDLVTHPKFYYFDTGIYRAIRPKGPLDTSSEMDGPALETLFLQEARAINDYFSYEYDFFYWRTKSKIEVDFIAYGEKGLIAFEIKRKEKILPKDLQGLRLFSEDYPIAKLYLFYGGSERYYEGNIEVVPFVEGLRQLKKILGK